MVTYIPNRTYNLPDGAVTPQATYLNRRNILRLAAATCGSLLAGGLTGSARAQRAAGDPTAGLYPAVTNPAYASAQGSRQLARHMDAITYNNFYEYGTIKNIWREAQALPRRPWTVEIDGLVAKPQTLDIDSLIGSMPLEERVYRHRCVETWSMVVPWSGFSLRHLLAKAEPMSDARFVAFETAELWNRNDPFTAPFPWPYREGLRLDEAMNDLSFIATGLYGEPLPSQNGAPLRLVVPWKYGFKGIKSIVRITLANTPPPTFWNEANSTEYGFWANVNPNVPHRRWSQAREWDLSLGREQTFPTLEWNGYGEWVAGMYAGMEGLGERLYV